MRKELEHICFHVEKVDSVDLMKNSEMLFNSDNAYAIVGKWPVKETEPNKPAKIKEKTLNFCSSLYNLIENRAILEPLIPVLESKFKHLEISAISDRDAQFTVRISPTIPAFSPNTEVIKPAVTFINSYDGKVLAQATGGLVRHLVDEKGNVFTTFSSFLKGLSFAYTFKHSNEDIYSMEQISSKIDEYIAEFAKVESQIDMLKAITIEKATNAKLEKLVRNLAKGTIFPLKEVEETIERIQYEEMIFDTEPNFWSIYNAMNYILENTEASLTRKMRMDADTKIYANLCEFLTKKKK